MNTNYQTMATSGRIASVLKANRAETAEMFLRNWFPPNLVEAKGPIITKARTMPGAKLVTLPVVHLSNLESPDLVMRITLEFLV